MGKSNYIFPEKLGNKMASVPVRTQLEASMMSMVFILIGMILMGVYFSIYAAWPWYIKILFVINLIAGAGMMLSYLVTTFQQYRTVMEVIEVQKEIKNG